MKAHTKEIDMSRLHWRFAWRNLRVALKDPAELAWRLDPDYKFAPSTRYTWFHKRACVVMYARTMPMPANKVQMQKLVFKRGRWYIQSQYEEMEANHPITKK